jgi:hypothetical protein
VCASKEDVKVYVLFGSWKNILLENYSFIDFWSYHLCAASLASEVHDLSYENVVKPIFFNNAPVG